MNLLLALGFVLVWKALMPHGALGMSAGSWLTLPVLMAQGMGAKENSRAVDISGVALKRALGNRQ